MHDGAVSHTILAGVTGFLTAGGLCHACDLLAGDPLTHTQPQVKRGKKTTVNSIHTPS
jgi:hypothetical protein